ncbi:MAG: hypothetical protein MJ214_01500 [Bacilli bacterium]|nr:hypothetical protein [Bacilli bacterium]
MSYKNSPLEEVKELLEKLPPNVWIRVYYGNKGRRVKVMKPKKKNKYTLNGLGSRMDRFETKLDQLAMTVDRLVVTVDNLAKYVTEGFKQINSRLDYIVQANNLKDLPKNR